MSEKPVNSPGRQSHYTIVIIGGGIVGAGLLRDAALHGVDALMIDKFDFSSQTSGASSKMLHGGIRYLETFEFDLVSESLHEKNLWLKLAPHLCYEHSFHLPIYKGSTRPPWMIKTALSLYDLLSSFENTPHRVLNSVDTLKALPHLRQARLQGAGVYYDAVVEDAKLTLEIIYDALEEPCAKALNYTELLDFEIHGDRYHLKLRDTLTQEHFELTTDNLLFATGPFTDHFLNPRTDLHWSPKLLPSKGSHLWLPKEKLPIEYPVVLTPNDGRVIFVIPQRGAVLVGTTEVTLEEGELFNLTPSESEVSYLLSNLKDFFPTLSLSVDDIISTFAGIRPLVRDGESTNRSKAARTHQCYWPRHNLGVILGGKYTTFRVMAQDLLRPVMKRLGRPYDENKTKQSLRRRSVITPFGPCPLGRAELQAIMENEHVRTLSDLLERRIGHPHPGLGIQEGSVQALLEAHRDLVTL
jgi:glycerol-3-phosphate dehydrogenase